MSSRVKKWSLSLSSEELLRMLLITRYWIREVGGDPIEQKLYSRLLALGSRPAKKTAAPTPARPASKTSRRPS